MNYVIHSSEIKRPFWMGTPPDQLMTGLNYIIGYIIGINTLSMKNWIGSYIKHGFYSSHYMIIYKPSPLNSKKKTPKNLKRLQACWKYTYNYISWAYYFLYNHIKHDRGRDPCAATYKRFSPKTITSAIEKQSQAAFTLTMHCGS